MSNGLLLITGESFRLGTQFSRTRGIEDSFRRQQVACESHIRFVKYCEEKKNIKIDVALYTYTLNNEWDNKLKDWYGSYLVKSSYTTELAKSEPIFKENALADIAEFMQEKNIKYDFILLIRTDFYLKNYFSEVFDSCPNKIIFAFIDKFTTEQTNFPAVCHNITYVPEKFYSLLFSNSFLNMHDSAQKLLNYVAEDCIDFYSNTSHFTSTDLGWNPIFVIVGRNEIREPSQEGISYTNGTYIALDKEYFNKDIFKETFQEALENKKFSEAEDKV